MDWLHRLLHAPEDRVAAWREANVAHRRPRRWHQHGHQAHGRSLPGRQLLAARSCRRLAHARGNLCSGNRTPGRCPTRPADRQALGRRHNVLLGRAILPGRRARSRPVGGQRPRYGSEPGVSFYSHLSDQFGAFYSKVIAATAHEAPHILDGLLLHESGLRIERHTTDTGGFTEIVFALCALLGFRFVPRIRDLPTTRLYTFDRPRAWPTLEPVIGGRLHEQRIIDGWSDLLRLVGSIRAGTAVPSHVITKLAANPRQSSLARALIEVGRLEHTRFLLDLLRSPTLRHEMQTSLNKGEASNNLRKAVFFNRLGQVRDRAYESQLHRVRGLNLLVAAIVLWNSRYLDEAVGALRRHGHDVPERILAHVWPLAWDHINLTGEYTWSADAPRDPDRLRDLRLDQLTPPLPLQQAA